MSSPKSSVSDDQVRRDQMGTYDQAMDPDIEPVIPGKHTHFDTEQELRQRPELVAIDGNLYNLSQLAPHHPGGTMILSAGASDSSALFHSMHPNIRPSQSQLLLRFHIGTYQPASTNFSASYAFDSVFATELKTAVKKAMGSRRWYAPLGFWFRCAIIALLTLVAEVYWARTGSVAWGVVAGVAHGLIGLCIQHDASHGAVSKDPNVNGFLAYGADIIGNSRWCPIRREAFVLSGWC